MLTKPSTLLRDWIKFWHFLNFHVDASTPKYDPETHTSKKLPKGLPNPPPLQHLMKLRKWVTKVKVIVAMAALAVASTACLLGRILQLACAMAAAACAGWLACSCQSTPSNEGRSNEICLDGRGGGKTIKSHWPQENKRCQGRRTGRKHTSKGK